MKTYEHSCLCKLPSKLNCSKPFSTQAFQCVLKNYIDYINFRNIKLDKKKIQQLQSILFQCNIIDETKEEVVDIVLVTKLEEIQFTNKRNIRICLLNSDLYEKSNLLAEYLDIIATQEFYNFIKKHCLREDVNYESLITKSATFIQTLNPSRF